MQEQVPFLDVSALIEQSHPRPRVGWLGYAAGAFLLVVLGSAYASSLGPESAVLVDVLSALAMLGLMAGLAVMTSSTVRRQRQEIKRIEALEELIQLRRWPEAAGTVRAILSEPARAPQARIQALLLLSSVLARYQRFEDAIVVHNHLLDTVMFDDATAHGIRLGRAMAMLRQDHLLDADRAITELRRTSQGRSSGGLALVELYRDVKTGHPTEAVERFEKSLPLFREQLGPRTGDAYALLATACDMLRRADEAAEAYGKATLLTPVTELNRRYPEVTTLAERYAPTPVPPGLGRVA